MQQRLFAVTQGTPAWIDARAVACLSFELLYYQRSTRFGTREWMANRMKLEVPINMRGWGAAQRELFLFSAQALHAAGTRSTRSTREAAALFLCHASSSSPDNYLHKLHSQTQQPANPTHHTKQPSISHPPHTRADAQTREPSRLALNASRKGEHEKLHFHSRWPANSSHPSPPRAGTDGRCCRRRQRGGTLPVQPQLGGPGCARARAFEADVHAGRAAAGAGRAAAPDAAGGGARPPQRVPPRAAAARVPGPLAGWSCPSVACFAVAVNA